MLRSTDAGKLVTCVALIDERERAAFNIDDTNGPVWRTDRCCMWNNWDEGEIPLPYCPDSALLPIRPEPDPLDEEPTLDVSDIEGFHQLAASGQLADMLTRIGGASDEQMLKRAYPANSDLTGQLASGLGQPVPVSTDPTSTPSAAPTDNVHIVPLTHDEGVQPLIEEDAA